MLFGYVTGNTCCHSSWTGPLKYFGGQAESTHIQERVSDTVCSGKIAHGT